MLQILFLVVVYIGILFYKSKAVNFVLVTYIAILVSLNSYNPDYNSYVLIYNAPEAAQEEIGFRFLCKIGNLLGLPYDVFHAVIVILAFGLFLHGAKLLFKSVGSKMNSFYLASYIVFPMALDVILLRSFLAASIIIYALHFLCQKKSIKYMASIMVASSIHISALFFLLLLPAAWLRKGNETLNGLRAWREQLRDINKRHRWVKIVIVLAIVAIVTLFRFRVPQLLLSQLGYSLVKINLWLDGGNITFRMIILCVILHFVNFIPYFLLRKLSFSGGYIDEIKQIDNLVMTVNYTLLINVVFMVYSDQFLRVLSVGVIINSLYYSVLLGKEKRQKMRFWIIILGMMAPAFLFLYRMFAYVTPNGVPYIEYIFNCVIENNFLLNFLGIKS